MKKVFILFTCDAWHTNESRRILTVGTSLEFCHRIAKQHAEEENDPLSEEDLNHLKSTNQTQGLDENYLIEEFSVNSYFG